MFAAGWATLAIALLPPLDALAEELFSAHMVQHLLLIVGAAPLLVGARTGRTLLAGVPGIAMRLRPALHRLRIVLSSVRRPVIAWGVATGVLWGWHVPAAYETALEVPWLHATEHATLLATAVLVWSVALDRHRHRELAGLGRALLLFASAIQSGLLGALLVFASRPLYPNHAAGAVAHGLGPLGDQQLAGALMWVPPMFVYLSAAAGLLLRWFRTLEPAVGREEVPA